MTCLLSQLSCTPPPPLPGGFASHEPVYYTAHTQTLPNGEKVTYGALGKVVGPPGDGRLAVLFPTAPSGANCLPTQLARTPCAAAPRVERATHDAPPLGWPPS